MKTEPTFEIKIYVGLKPGYEPCSNWDMEQTKTKIKTYLQEYANRIGFCTTLSDTEFIYTSGNERGIVIGIINYPRFPNKKENLIMHAITIATDLLSIAKQERISIVTTDKTYLIE